MSDRTTTGPAGRSNDTYGALEYRRNRRQRRTYVLRPMSRNLKHETRNSKLSNEARSDSLPLLLSS